MTLLARKRAPLVLLIYLAGREARLRWTSPDEFAILQMPAPGRPSARRQTWPVRVLRVADSGWELIGFFSLPLLASLFSIWAILAMVRNGPPTIALMSAGTTVALLAVAVLGMLLGILRSAFRDSVPASMAEYSARLAAGSAAQDHWSVVIFHATTADRCAVLLGELMADNRLRGRLLCFEDGVTSIVAVHALRSSPAARQRFSAPPVLLLAQDSAWRLTLRPVHPGIVPFGRRVAVGLLIGLTVAVLACLARVVADLEAGSCAPTACADRPTTYGSAVYWLMNRLFGGDPEGIGAATIAGRVIGVCTTMLGIIVGGVVLGSIVAAMTRRLEPPADLNDLSEDAVQFPALPVSANGAAGPKPGHTGSVRSTAALAGTALLFGIAAGIMVTRRHRR
jgi:hypothetical protein